MSSGYPSPIMYEYLMKSRTEHAETLVELEVMTADRDKWKELYDKVVRGE